MSDTPRQLPIVKLGHKEFFRDDRLKEYRNVKNPHEKYDFEQMDLVSGFLDIGGELESIIDCEAKRLGIKVIGGQSMLNCEDITHLITPNGELFTIIRNYEPDEEAIKEILGEEGDYSAGL